MKEIESHPNIETAIISLITPLNSTPETVPESPVNPPKPDTNQIPNQTSNPIPKKPKRVPNPYPKSKHIDRKSGNYKTRSNSRKKPGCGQCWTVEEFAEFFNVMPNTVRNWIKAGKIQAVKLSNYYRIPDSFILSLISGQSLESLK